MSDDYVPEHRADDVADEETKYVLPSNVYDKLKPVAQIWLPALAVFYASIGALWGLPRVDEVVGTIVALDLLLGTVLGISSAQYNKSDARFDGAIVVTPGEVEDTTNVRVKLDPAAIEQKDEVTVKVERP